MAYLLLFSAYSTPLYLCGNACIVGIREEKSDRALPRVDTAETFRQQREQAPTCGCSGSTSIFDLRNERKTCVFKDHDGGCARRCCYCCCEVSNVTSEVAYVLPCRLLYDQAVRAFRTKVSCTPHDLRTTSELQTLHARDVPPLTCPQHQQGVPNVLCQQKTLSQQLLSQHDGKQSALGEKHKACSL